VECDDFPDIRGRLDNAAKIIDSEKRAGRVATAGIWYCPNGPNEDIIGVSKCSGRVVSEPVAEYQAALESLQTILQPLPREEDRVHLDSWWLFTNRRLLSIL